jgi:hypothetical protein
MPSLPKQKAPKGNASHASSSVVDPRFASLGTDPRFRLPSKKNSRVKLDKRFSRLLTDEDFAQQASVDRYGRKIPKGQGRKKLERLYQLPSEDEDESDDDDEDDEDGDKDKGLGDESGEDDTVIRQNLKKADRIYDPARDGGFSTSDSDSDSQESEIDAEIDAEIDGQLPEESEAVPLGEISKRLAVVNLDWDNVRAQDIFAVASSFASDHGTVLNVTIYPSEFGRERMETEDLEGPPKEIFAGAPPLLEPVSSPSSEDDEVDSEEEDEKIKKVLLQSDDGAEFDSAALRKYQLDRLRYYYAVISCSSKDVAKVLYDAMDGQEYLSSANFFDMRFIPDHVTFDEKERDSCHFLPNDYNPTEFTTDALMHSKVKLTWDADDNKRKEVQKKAFSRAEMNENDLLAYIGSNTSSSEFESEEDIAAVAENDNDDDNASVDAVSIASRATSRQAKRDSLRAALGLDLEPLPSSAGSKKRENKPVGDMLITFTPALSAAAKKGETSVFENEPIARDESTMDMYARKERERKARRKERAKAARNGNTVAADETRREGTLEDDAAEGNDKGFDDPFFENPNAAITEAKRAKKAQKVRFADRQDESDEADNAQRAELELLMMDDGAEQNTSKRNRLEKQSSRSTKSMKKGKKAAENKDDNDDLQVDINDPRLASLYTDPDYAIDPTSHLFKDTKGTRAILEEKRRRGENRESEKGKRPRGEVVDLIERVKKRIKT